MRTPTCLLALLAAPVLAVLCLEPVHAEQPSPQSGTEQPNRARTQRPSVDDAMKTRAKFGFRQDRDYVASLNDDTRIPVDLRTGIPLTDSETQDLAKRDQIGRGTLKLNADLPSTAGERFGGVYLDQEAGGRAIVWLDQPTDAEKEKVTQELPAGTVIDYRRPDFSYQQLQADDASAASGLAQLLADGLPVTSGRLSLPDNRVLVNVTRQLSSAEESRVRGLGPSVVVHQVKQAAHSKASRRSGDVAAYGGPRISEAAPTHLSYRPDACGAGADLPDITEDGDNVRPTDISARPGKKQKSRGSATTVIVDQKNSTWQAATLDVKAYRQADAGSELRGVVPVTEAKTTGAGHLEAQVSWAKVPAGEYFLQVDVISDFRGQGASCASTSIFTARRDVQVLS